ncbi:MAG: hypothetical protein WBO46_10780 [Caldilineaceae bacterium]
MGYEKIWTQINADKRRFCTRHNDLNRTFFSLQRRREATVQRKRISLPHCLFALLSLCSKKSAPIRLHPRSPVANANTKTPTLADRRSGSDAYLATAKSGLGFGKCFDARGAQPHGFGRAALSHFHLLNVHIPFVAGGFLGPRSVVAKLGTLAALLTFRHNSFAPLLSCVRSFPPLFVLLNLLVAKNIRGNPPIALDTISV